MIVTFELTDVFDTSVTLKAKSDWEQDGDPTRQRSVSKGTGELV